MPKIIFNYKICDKAFECGGITECPTKAITYDQISRKPIWDSNKCTFCLKCTLPDTCPVGAIMFAKDDDQERVILDTINADVRSEDWLWQERYGVQPARTPLAQILTPKNFNSVTKSAKSVIIDVWHEDFLDCRLHSPLFSDLTKGLSDYKIYKLDAKRFPELAQQLDISQFPTIVVYKDFKKVFVHTGYIKKTDIFAINLRLKNLLLVKST